MMTGLKFNSADFLPPVDCHLIILVDGEQCTAKRTAHISDKYGDMIEYRLSDGRVIVGRLEWTYA